MRWKLYGAAGVLALLGIFVLQNTRVVEVRFLLWELEMSRALVLLGVLGAGLVLGWLLGSLRPRGRS